MYTLFRLPFILLELALRGGAEAIKELLRLAAGPPGVDERPAGPSPDGARERAEAFAAAEAAARPEPGPRRRPAPVRAPEPTAPEAEILGERPAHVSRDADAVASFGPSDDPAARLEAQPPWAGYEEQPAAVIIARVRSADEATKAVVLLYERQHKKRRTVLQAAGG